MRIIFVRHGHPDYARDCLTPLGVLQAEAAALRLQGEGICRIFSSTCGRALETAERTAKLLQLPVEKCDFMREIRWGTAEGEALYENGHPWSTANRMVAQGESLLDAAWAKQEPFRRNKVVDNIAMIASALDELLASLGYTREGLYYRVTGDAPDTIAVFSHGGASAAMLSHLFNLAFPFTCAAMGPDYTAVTIAALPTTPDSLVSPRFELLNDAKHIQGLHAENYFGN